LDKKNTTEQGFHYEMLGDCQYNSAYEQQR